jgi:hypothetical protein
MANESQVSQLRLPIQTAPINRRETLPPFLIKIRIRDPISRITRVTNVATLNVAKQMELVTGAAEGKEIEFVFIPQVYSLTGVRDSHAYFSPEVDQRLGICPVLSAYAVARCFRAGGLF